MHGSAQALSTLQQREAGQQRPATLPRPISSEALAREASLAHGLLPRVRTRTQVGWMQLLSSHSRATSPDAPMLYRSSNTLPACHSWRAHLRPRRRQKGGPTHFPLPAQPQAS